MTSKEYLSDGWGVGLYGSLFGEWAPKVAEKFWRIFVYECVISFATFPLFFWFCGGKYRNFMDFSNLSCFMLWIWLWCGNYPDGQLTGGWTSKLSTCYCVVPENWSQGLVCPCTHTYLNGEENLNTEKHRTLHGKWRCYNSQQWLSPRGHFVPYRTLFSLSWLGLGAATRI